MVRIRPRMPYAIGANRPEMSDEHRATRPRRVEVKTLFYTQSSLLLVQLWSGRLEVDAFQNTAHIQNVLLGPLVYGGMQGFRSSRLGYPAVRHRFIFPASA
jgi:hypothetical protein